MGVSSWNGCKSQGIDDCWNCLCSHRRGKPMPYCCLLKFHSGVDECLQSHITHGNVFMVYSKGSYILFLSWWEKKLLLDQHIRFLSFNNLFSWWSLFSIEEERLRFFDILLKVEKVQYINFIKEIPTPEGRNAAMALFCGQTKDAEAILLQSGLVYRAIQMHLDSYNWDR